MSTGDTLDDIAEAVGHDQELYSSTTMPLGRASTKLVESHPSPKQSIRLSPTEQPI